MSAINYGSTDVFVPGLNDLVPYPIFGWDTEERIALLRLPDDVHFFNYIRYAAYVPGLNIIAGIALGALALFGLANADNDEMFAAFARMGIRSLATIALGPLLLVPDLIKNYMQQQRLDEIRLAKDRLAHYNDQY